MTQAGLGQLRLGALLANVVHHSINRETPDQAPAGIDHRRGHQIVALEGIGRVFGAVLGIELDALVHHDAGDAELQVGYDQARERKRALERLLAIDDEQLIRVVR